MASGPPALPAAKAAPNGPRSLFWRASSAGSIAVRRRGPRGARLHSARRLAGGAKAPGAQQPQHAGHSHPAWLPGGGGHTPSLRASLSGREAAVSTRRVRGAAWGGVGVTGGGRVQDDPLLDDLAETVLELAEQVALEAGDIIRRKLGKATQVTSKEVRCDLVTEVDRECEHLITRTVQGVFPLHAVIGEETATADKMQLLEDGALGPRDWAWIIDPIDGTLNFVGGIPMCAVSVAVARGGAVEVGAVYHPFSNELFSTRRGEGAYLNGRLLAGADGIPELELEDAAVAVGFPSLSADRARLLRAMAAVAPHARTMRAFGSAALHMSYVAAGRLGCFFEPALKPWDIAAARLLVEEAGGIVTTMDGSELPLCGGSVVASRGGKGFHARIVSFVA